MTKDFSQDYTRIIYPAYLSDNPACQMVKNDVFCKEYLFIYNPIWRLFRVYLALKFTPSEFGWCIYRMKISPDYPSNMSRRVIVREFSFSGTKQVGFLSILANSRETTKSRFEKNKNFWCFNHQSNCTYSTCFCIMLQHNKLHVLPILITR